MRTGAVIEELRTKRKLTQEELAYKAGMGTQLLDQIEKGEVVPSIQDVEVICDALKIPPAALDLLSLEIQDVPPRKQPAFDILMPNIRALIFDVWEVEE